jgi:predicted nucleotidyltransferase
MPGKKHHEAIHGGYRGLSPKTMLSKVFQFPVGYEVSMESSRKIWYKKVEHSDSKEVNNMMSKKDRKILNQFSTRIHERFSDARVWAFGSRARGDATWDSDFDVFVVLSEVDQKAERWIRDIAWEVGFENERVITTVLIDKEQFENGPMSESTIVDNILREGISA